MFGWYQGPWSSTLCWAKHLSYHTAPLYLANVPAPHLCSWIGCQKCHSSVISTPAASGLHLFWQALCSYSAWFPWLWSWIFLGTWYQLSDSCLLTSAYISDYGSWISHLNFSGIWSHAVCSADPAPIQQSGNLWPCPGDLLGIPSGLAAYILVQSSQMRAIL